MAIDSSSLSEPTPAHPSWFTPKRLLVFCVINLINYVGRGVIASNGVNGSPRSCADSGVCSDGSGIQPVMEISETSPSRVRWFEVVDFIQMVQSFLPAKEAARTMVLSKIWLHAWSTSPTLRIYVSTDWSLIKSVHRRHSSTSPCCLLDDMFSRENLRTLSLQVDNCLFDTNIWIDPPVMIKSCVASLRVVELVKVCISQDVLDNLFSACTLLEKINIQFHNELEIIKVKRLDYLRELEIASPQDTCNLEFDSLPSLYSFGYSVSPPGMARHYIGLGDALAANSDSFGRLRQLCLDNVIMTHTLIDTINSVFPFLESLSIDMNQCYVYRLEITCISLKRLKLIRERESNEVTEVNVCSQKLLSLHYRGIIIPTFSFQTCAPKEIEIQLPLSNPVSSMPSFFTQMRKALDISSSSSSSSKFKIKIIYNSDGDFSGTLRHTINNVDDLLKERDMFLALKNVEEMSFDGFSSKRLLDHSSLFNALISICHPKYVKVSSIVFDCYWKLVIESMIICQIDLKDAEIKIDTNGRWETLKKSSSISNSTSREEQLSCCDPHNVMLKLYW